MAWQSLIVAIGADAAEPLSDALLERGALAVSIEDAAAGTAAEQPIFGEPNVPSERIWAASEMSVLLGVDCDARALLEAAANDAGLATLPRFRIEHVADEDWVRKTQAQFEPIRVSNRLWIVPSWHDAVDAAAINISLDPGLAFGTGSHPTTQLCLRWLESVVHDRATVIDYGCGSGILAIAAAKLGALRVVGVDIDPDAVAAAQANARINQVVAEFFASTRPITEIADVLVANILANPLKVLAPALATHVRKGGRLALAGLLTPQADEVVAAYAADFRMHAVAAQDGWTLLEGARR